MEGFSKLAIAAAATLMSLTAAGRTASPASADVYVEFALKGQFLADEPINSH
jgi:hypothetical protein